MPDQSSPWTTLSSRRHYESPYVAVDEDEVRHRTGKVHPYTALRFRIAGIAVLPILPDGGTMLVGQYRYVSKRYTWELPRGAGSLSTPALETARRELAEETGLTGGHWIEIATLMASPGISDEIAPCFVAWGLEQRQADPDPQEDLVLKRIPFEEAVHSCLDGTIRDAVSVALILTVHARAARGDLPHDLLQLLRRP